MLTVAIDAVAWVLTRMVWIGLRIYQPFRKPDDPSCDMPHPRDYEWTDYHWCEVHKGWAKHHFILWQPERVTTARCFSCGFEATL